MPIDPTKYRAPADHADVARVALQASSMGSNLMFAVEAIAHQTGVDVSVHMGLVRESIKELDRYFDELTGYVPE